MLHGFFNGLEIKPVMVGEQLVFRADDGQLGIGGNILHAIVVPFQSFPFEYTAQLRQRDGGVDPFQQQEIE